MPMTLLEAQSVAKIAAKTLAVELAFPNKPNKGTVATWQTIAEASTKRGSDDWQTAENPATGGRTSSAKVNRRMPATDPALDNKVICVVCSELSTDNVNDVDHAYPYQGINQNLQDLLWLMNNEPHFVTALNDELNQYDKLNKLPNTFKSSGESIKAYFIKQADDTYVINRNLKRLSYNNYANLWLMCHCCNLNKSSANVMDWFKQEPLFGDAFLQYVKDNGDYQDGLIVGKVGKDDSAEFTVKRKDKSGAQTTVKRTISSGGTGIAEIAMHWFTTNRPEVKPNAEALEKAKMAFRQQLLEIYDLKSQDKELASRYFKDLTVISKIMEKIYQEMLATSSNSSSPRKSPSLSSSTDSEVRAIMRANMPRIYKVYRMSLKTKYKILSQMRKDPTKRFQSQDLKDISDLLTIEFYTAKDFRTVCEKISTLMAEPACNVGSIKKELEKYRPSQADYAAQRESALALAETNLAGWEAEKVVSSAAQAAAAQERADRLAAEAEKEQAEQRAQGAEQRAQGAEQRAQTAEAEKEQEKQARLAAEAELAKFKEMFAKTQQPAGTASTASNMPLDTPAIAQTSSLPTTLSRPKRKLSNQADVTSSTASNPSRLLTRAATLATDIPSGKKSKIDKSVEVNKSTPSSPFTKKQ